MRNSDGSWSVGSDFLERAGEFERTRAGGAQIVIRSWISVSDQLEHPGATWLDTFDDASDGRMGQVELAAKRRARLNFLRGQGVLVQSEARVSEEVLVKLKMEELLTASKDVARRTGQGAAELQPGGSFRGTMQTTVDLAQGRMAVIGNGKEFVLVPWRRELSQNLERGIEVKRVGAGVSWTLEKGISRGIGR